MHKRWLGYFVIGICFGIIDWYFLDLLATLLAGLGQNEGLIEAGFTRLLIIVLVMSLNYGIWLVPVIPTAIYEVNRSHSLVKAALSAVVIWVAAIFSYYAYYTFLLMFVGLPHLEFMLFANRHSAAYWADWWPPFRRVVLLQFFEWIGVAVIGGVLVGTVSAVIFRRITQKRAANRSF